MIENGDLVTVVTTDSIADSVNFVERLRKALPGLRAAATRDSLKLAAAPKLRNIVLLGKTEAPGFVGDAEFDAAGAERHEICRCTSRASPCACATSA